MWAGMGAPLWGLGPLEVTMSVGTMPAGLVGEEVELRAATFTGKNIARGTLVRCGCISYRWYEVDGVSFRLSQVQAASLKTGRIYIG